MLFFKGAHFVLDKRLKERKWVKEQRREEERRKKLDAFTKGCTKKAIVWDLIGSVGGFSTAGLMTRTIESKKGWRLQHGATVVYRGPEGLIPTEKRFKIAEYNKKNRGKKNYMGLFPSIVVFTVEGLEKEERIYDAMIRRKQKAQKK